jgi:hypothetical protein
MASAIVMARWTIVLLNNVLQFFNTVAHMLHLETAPQSGAVDCSLVFLQGQKSKRIIRSRRSLVVLVAFFK